MYLVCSILLLHMYTVYCECTVFDVTLNKGGDTLHNERLIPSTVTSAISGWQARNMVHCNSAWVNSLRQCWYSMHRGRLLVCRAAPRPVIENVYVMLQRCWYWRKYYKKKRNKKKEWTKSWFVRSKSSFATICKGLTVKLYTKDIKNYIKMPE